MKITKVETFLVRWGDVSRLAEAALGSTSATAVVAIHADGMVGLGEASRMQGGVAAVGLAGGAELAVSLMPFLLRGVNLLGVNSAATRRDKRLAVWARIAGDLRPRHLARIASQAIALEELPQACAALISGSHIGRTLVRIAE